MKQVAERLVKELHSKPQWDGMLCIEEMRDSGNRNWRQMEWAGFYFEHLASEVLSQPGDAKLPSGHTFSNTIFDIETSNGDIADLKVHTLTAPPPQLNDVRAVNEVISQRGEIYFLVLNVDMEWDNETHDFANAVEALKGKPSRYVTEGRSTGRRRRRRKKAAHLKSLDVYMFNENDVNTLAILRQGRNSNGRQRPDKYGLTKDSQPIWSYAI